MHVTHKTAKPLRDLQAARDAIAPLYDVGITPPYVQFWENSTKTPHVREILILVAVGSHQARENFFNIVKQEFAKLPAKSWAVYKHGKQLRAKVFYTS